MPIFGSSSSSASAASRSDLPPFEAEDSLRADRGLDRLLRIRRALAQSRGGKVQFIVDPLILWAPAGSLPKGSGSSLIARENRILLEPALPDPWLIRELGRRCFEANVNRYKSRFTTLALIEKVPGVRGLWARIIETLTDAVLEDLVRSGVAGIEAVPAYRARLDSDQVAARTIEEILDVINHGIDGHVRSHVQSDPIWRNRVAQVLPPDDPILA